MANDSYHLLRYTNSKRKSGVRQQYDRWREAHGLPQRCDMVGCRFYAGDLVWNGQPLRLTLDHVNGVNSDDRPKNLRLVCPNCDAQLTTKGGGNRGRILKAPGGFGIANKTVRGIDYTLPAEPGEYVIEGGSASYRIGKSSKTPE